MRAVNYGLCVRLIWIIFIFLIFVITFKCRLISPINTFSFGSDTSYQTPPLWEKSLDFSLLHFNNATGNPSGCYLVPNYIHFIYFGGDPISYTQLICILAAFKNQQPEKIFFHYDIDTTFTGRYWKVLEHTPGFHRVIELHKVELPDSIFGQALSPGWRKWHGGDITRIKMIMEYGGIYLDNDCYLVNSIDNYRKFEMILNWDEGEFLGNQVIIAHKDARFLKRWLETYREYDKDKWYYNAGEKPTTEVLYKEPELIHRVKVLFGTHAMFAHKVLQEQWNGWKDMHIIHLLIQHQYLFKNVTARAVFPVEFNETNIRYYTVSLREMAYDVYDTAKVQWSKDRFET